MIRFFTRHAGRLVIAAAGLLFGAGAWAAVFFVDPQVQDDRGDGSEKRPAKYIGTAAALMSRQGGDVLVLRPGRYDDPRDAVAIVPPGKPGAWNVVKAEVDGTVVIRAPLQLPFADHYLQFEGLQWEGTESKAVTGRYVKFLRCGFKDGPATDNTVILGIGSNDRTPGAQYILVEDAFVYGSGGRYNLLVYNADKIVLRRVVARHQAGWKDTKGDPQAVVSLYNSTDVLTQNLLLVDSGAPGYFEAALYHPSNSRASRNIKNIGAIILNTAGAAVGWDDHTASTGNLLEDSILWKAGTAITINGAAHGGFLNHLTIGRITDSGVNDWKDGGRFTLVNSLLWQVAGKNFRGIEHVDNVCSAPACKGEATLDPRRSGLSWLPRVDPGSALASAGPGGTPVGATVMKRLGVGGTLYGEAGFDRTTGQDLWPWPNEAAIKKAMCADSGIASGFCASRSLTSYVWEQLGNPPPSSLVPSR